MKKLLVLISVLILSSCSGSHIESPAEFEREYKMSKGAHTMHSYEYLGEKEGRVYLKKSSMSSFNQKKWHDKVFTAGITDLSPETQKELKALNKVYKQ